jgi:release factor glutamine methyltransferase
MQQPRGASSTLAREAALARRLWGRLLYWRFRLFQRHRYNRLVLERVAGWPILVLPEVFNPKLFRSGEFLARAIESTPLPADASVLDLGTGSGIGAIVAASRTRRVVAVDINPTAVRCARLNAALHGVEERVEVRQGDLFGPVPRERFDLVLFNPPFFRGVPRDALDQAWRSTDVAERFASELGEHLRPGGLALVVLSTDGDQPGFLRAFCTNHLTVEVAARRDLLNEVLTVYKLRDGC